MITNENTNSNRNRPPKPDTPIPKPCILSPEKCIKAPESIVSEFYLLKLVQLLVILPSVCIYLSRNTFFITNETSTTPNAYKSSLNAKIHILTFRLDRTSKLSGGRFLANHNTTDSFSEKDGIDILSNLALSSQTK